MNPKLPGRLRVGVAWLVVSASTHQLRRAAANTKDVVGAAGRIVPVLAVVSTIARTLVGVVPV